MGLFVDPVPVSQPGAPGSAASWQLLDFLHAERAATVAADGTATLQFGPVEGNQLWLIDRAVCSCSGTAATQPTCDLYVDEVDQRGLRDHSDVAFRDISEYPSALLVGETSTLLAVFGGAPAGETACLHIQYRLMVRA